MKKIMLSVDSKKSTGVVLSLGIWVGVCAKVINDIMFAIINTQILMTPDKTLLFIFYKF